MEEKLVGVPAVFLDRDGTINEQMGYVNHPSRFVLLPNSARAIRRLNQGGVLVIVISNQSGVARGYFPLSLVHRIHDIMKEMLAAQGAGVDEILFCPHHPLGEVPEYAVNCRCRKPMPGLVEKARRRFDVDMKRSFVVGDRCSDVELARRCGLTGVLVETGYGLGELEYVLPARGLKPDHVASDLDAAVTWILERGGAVVGD
ncbi:MAG: D-glycero-alpha-D-manno-heptose-1,7-bisphosphate 7-phosphatase [Desulfobacteraceae bacterium]